MEVAAVRQERIVGFLWVQSLIVGPLAAVARASLHALRSVIQLNCETAVLNQDEVAGPKKNPSAAVCNTLVVQASFVGVGGRGAVLDKQTR